MAHLQFKKNGQYPAMRNRRRKTGLDNLLAAPWWVSILFGIGAYIFLRWIIPSLFAGNPFLVSLSVLSQSIAWLALPAFGLIALIAFLGTKKAPSKTHYQAYKEKLEPRHTNASATALDHTWGNHVPPFAVHHTGEAPQIPTWNLGSLRSLEWKRFELLCAKYYETLGFKSLTQASGADGGIDIRLYRSDLTHPMAIVQCKAWNSKFNGVKELRELLGVMVHEKVTRGIFITSGSYTNEALAFAASNPIQLLDGENFLQRILQLEPEQRNVLAEFAFSGDYSTPSCASCGIKMIMRHSKNGPFWGCLNYPRCHTKIRVRKAANGS